PQVLPLNTSTSSSSSSSSSSPSSAPAVPLPPLTVPVVGVGAASASFRHAAAAAAASGFTRGASQSIANALLNGEFTMHASTLESSSCLRQLIRQNPHCPTILYPISLRAAADQ